MASSQRPRFYFEAELINGLRPLVEAELGDKFGTRARILVGRDEEAVSFRLKGRSHDWSQLRLPTAIYTVKRWDIPRPKALLGHQNFRELLEQIQQVVQAYPRREMQTLSLSAAGKDSSVFRRLTEELAQETGLKVTENGDLFLRVRRIRDGWETLVRTTPRPLGTRPWRVVNWPGALSGPLCAAMVTLSQPRKSDRVLNLMCGSGSLLAERGTTAGYRELIGLDADPEALAAAEANLAAARVESSLLVGDATDTALETGAFDAIFCDLPWGQLVGSGRENEVLYPKFLAESGRLANQGARLVVITHDIKRFEDCLRREPSLWRVEQTIKIQRGNIRPRIYLLRSAD